MKFYALILSTALVLFSCTSTVTDSISTQDNLYDNSSKGISLQFPATWTLALNQTIQQYHVDLVAKAPENAMFTPNVNIIYEIHSGTTDWSQILATAHSQLQTMYTDLSNYSDSLLTSNGVQYAEISYTTSLNGYSLKVRQDLVLNRGRDITITYTDLSTRFDGNSDFLSIHASLIITP